MTKRREERVKKFFLAKIVLTSGEIFAYTQNLSISGVCFFSNHEIRIGEQADVMLSASGLSGMRVKGPVVWKTDLPATFKAKYKYGIALEEVTEDYKEYVEKTIEHTKERERRKNPRFGDVLVIENKDVLDLLGASTLNISADGLYIKTAKKLKQGDKYNLRLVGPQLEQPITCVGQVVTVFDAPDNDEEAFFGAGLRLMSFDGKCREHFADYIKGLEELHRFHWPPELVPSKRDEES